LEVAELFADGLAGRAQLYKAYSRAKAFAQREEREGRWLSAFTAHAAHGAAYCTLKPSKFEGYSCGADFQASIAAGIAAKIRSSGPEKNERYAEAEAAERAAQAQLLRDILANPFREIPGVDQCVRTADVLELAQGIYDSRSFEQLPALATLLADRGFDNEEILSHLRDVEPHVRGCWALDIVVGKAPWSKNAEPKTDPED
jgi:hypothetical protein